MIIWVVDGCMGLSGHVVAHTWTWPRLCTQARYRVAGSCVADLVLKVIGVVCQLSHNARGLGTWQARLSRESSQWVWEPHWQESPPGNPSRSRNSDTGLDKGGDVMGQAYDQAGKVGRAPGQQAGTAGMPPGLDWGHSSQMAKSKHFFGLTLNRIGQSRDSGRKKRI